MTDEAPKQGRPTDYDDAFPEQARKLCQLGATDMELADFFDVFEVSTPQLDDVVRLEDGYGRS